MIFQRRGKNYQFCPTGMADKREGTALEMDEHLQIGCSWVPSTPAKPNLTTQQLICTNWQEKNHLSQVNLLEPERSTNLSEAGRLPGDFLQGTQYQTASACGSGSCVNGSSSNIWQPREFTNSVVGGVNLCSGMSFGKLLALAHAGGNMGAAGNAVAVTDVPTSSSSAMDFLPVNESQRVSFGNPSLQNQENLQTEKSDAELSIPNAVTDGSSIPSRPLFDLNVPPTIIDAASRKSTSQFEPATPQKNNQDESGMSSMQDLGAEVPARREQKITRDGAMLCHEKKEKSKLISNLLSVTSTQLQENHKPDKESADEADLVKTPQQKPRRKKHRPKVIIEGQNKKTPKSSSRTPNVPQDTRFKRKYVRRKGVNNVSEGKTDFDKSANNKKYARKHDKPEGSTDNGTTTGIADGGPSRNTRSSCRRSLNFNLEGQVKDNCDRGSRPENSDADQSTNNTGISHGCDDTVNQVLEASIEGPGPSSSPFPPVNNHRLTDHIVHTRGKCQIVFSDVTHDKVINTVEMGMNHDEQRTQKSLNDFTCSSTYLNPEKLSATAKAEVCNKYDTTHHNSRQSHLPLLSQNADKDNISRLQFPAMCKRRRTKNGRNMAMSTLQYTTSITGNRAKLEMHTLGDSSTNLFTSVNNATDDTQSGRQDQLVLGPPVKRRRSKGRKRLRDLSSVLEIHKLPASPSGAATKFQNEQGTEIVHESQRCVAILEARVTTKKRSKRSMFSNPTLQYNHQELSMIPIGPPLALTWKCTLSVESITEQLNELDLTERINHNLLMEYHQEHDALVPFSFDQARRQHRPRVDLDDETTRVWKLLLEDINSEGIDGTNEENTKKWEEERRVFSGRANSFIARMRLVQGDRPFSPWKGSVVDSVVGVFLTQNVSDHLSSSAFMLLVAQFPIDSKTHPSDLYEEKLDPEIIESETYDMDQGGTSGLNREISNHSVQGEDTEMPQVTDSMREIDRVKSFRNGMKESASEDDLRDQSTESSKCGPLIYSETVANKSESSIEDGDTFSSQKSANLITEQTTEKGDSCSLSSTSEEPIRGAESNRFTSSTFEKLLQRAGSILNGVYETGSDKKSFDQNSVGQSESSALNFQNSDHLDNATYPGKAIAPSIKYSSYHMPRLGDQATQYDLSPKTGLCFQSYSEKEMCAAEISELSSESALRTSQKITLDSVLEGPNLLSSNKSSNNDRVEINQTGKVPTDASFQGTNFETQVTEVPIYPQNATDVRGTNSILDDSEQKDIAAKDNPDYHTGKSINRPKARRGRTRRKVKRIKWDQLKKEAVKGDRERVRNASTMDSVDWDAVRCANVNKIADIIKERGMNNMLARRIKGFLNRLVRDHGSIDLEWLRDVPPDKAKEYLLSIKGLGLKSVECVRLLTLHHVAFPVDTNVGRIAVRLGWVPLQPLPESLQLHLLELYPVLESIQKYLWPRLCKLDQGTLYELHYQMITFGKVFCTKSKPNCNACPMRGECRHFASAFASARFALPAPGEKGIISTNENTPVNQNPLRCMNALVLPPLQINEMGVKFGTSQPIIEEPPSPEPIIEVPATPEPVNTQFLESTIESDFDEEPVEIPTIHLNMEEFTHNLQKIMHQNTELQEDDMSKALVALTSEAASIPVPKLKNISRLRTEHRVYELPDSHPLLQGVNKREPDDPCPYLLAIWTPGETVDSIKPPGRQCKFHGLEKLCTDETCSSCNNIREANSQTVRGTLLIPSRTAMRGSFPLNGTYFQVNEVFSDHESSLSPFDVPREWLWNLPRRTVFFGTSIPTIFKGLSTEGIQYCFWRGFVCVRGFDRKTRAPRPLVARLHFPASKLSRRKEKMGEEYS